MQRQTMGHQAIELASNPPILRLARRLEMLHQESGTIDIHDSGNGISELESEIAANPATSLSEAAVQIMLASAYIERLREDLVHDAEETLVSLQCLMRSVLSAFVRETGLDLSEFGGDRYLPGSPDELKATRFRN